MEIKNVKFIYGGKIADNAVDITIENGKIVSDVPPRSKLKSASAQPERPAAVSSVESAAANAGAEIAAAHAQVQAQLKKEGENDGE